MNGTCYVFLEASLILLIGLLDARSFRVREKAHKNLANLGSLAVPILEHYEKKSHSEEVRRRCYSLLTPFLKEISGRKAEKLLKRWPHVPWLSMSHGGYGNVNIWDYLDIRAQERTKDGEAAPDYTYWRLSTKEWVRRQFANRVSEYVIETELTRMYGEERNYCLATIGIPIPPVLPEKK